MSFPIFIKISKKLSKSNQLASGGHLSLSVLTVRLEILRKILLQIYFVLAETAVQEIPVTRKCWEHETMNADRNDTINRAAMLQRMCRSITRITIS